MMIKLFDLTWNGQVLAAQKPIGYIIAIKNKLKLDPKYKGYEHLFKIKFNSYGK